MTVDTWVVMSSNVSLHGTWGEFETFGEASDFAKETGGTVWFVEPAGNKLVMREYAA